MRELVTEKIFRGAIFYTGYLEKKVARLLGRGIGVAKTTESGSNEMDTAPRRLPNCGGGRRTTFARDGTSTLLEKGGGGACKIAKKQHTEERS